MVQKEFPNAYIILNNHHFIIRYRNNSNRNDKARYALFLRKTSKAIIDELGVPMRLGESIYEDLLILIIKFSEVEFQSRGEGILSIVFMNHVC